MHHDPSPLVGRVSVLADLVRRARDGRGSVLTGPRGSGGTRLLSEALQALRRVGVRAVRLPLPPPAEAARTSPFLAVLDRDVRARVAGDRAALRAAMLALELQAIAVDDARLLDDATGALLVELSRSGVAVVADATGPGGMPGPIRGLVEEGRATTTPLAPLAYDEATELAGHLLGDPVDSELADALLTASGGRPGALDEVVHDGLSIGAITRADGLWRLVGPLPAPRSVRTAVLDGFSALPPDQRGWIAAVAIAGTIADDLTGRIAAPGTVAAAADAGWTERHQRGGTRIASSRIGTALLGSLDARARIAVLRRLIDAAGSVGRPLHQEERVALLLWRIELGEPIDAAEALALARGPRTDRTARETLLRAAVAGGAPAAAELADHLRRTRRPDEALRVIRAAMPDTAAGGERVSLIRVRSMTTGIIERRSAEALSALDDHLAEAGPHRDLLAVRAGLLLLEGRPRETVEVAEAVLRDGGSTGFASAFALLQRALGLRELGELDRSLTAAARFGASPDVEEAFPQGGVFARWLPLELAVAVGADPGPAEQALTDALVEAPPALRPDRSPQMAYTLACIRLQRGDPASAVRLLREADGGSGGWRDGWRPRILAELLIAQALAGDLEAAGETGERLRGIACPPVQRARIALATAQLAAVRGDAPTAIRIAAETADAGQRAGLALDAFDAAFAGIRYGDPAAPGRLLALGSRPGGAGRAAQRAYASAAADEDPAAIDAAAAGLWDVGLRLHALEAAARGAELGSSEALQRLVAWSTRTPALQLPGVTDRRTRGLTAREREVALLAARGASDRSIATELGITLRTAQTHLGRALAKLGVHRRTELPRLVGEP
jgi:DNA-binding CsgD family transcriptional regulator